MRQNYIEILADPVNYRSQTKDLRFDTNDDQQF